MNSRDYSAKLYANYIRIQFFGAEEEKEVIFIWNKNMFYITNNFNKIYLKNSSI